MTTSAASFDKSFDICIHGAGFVGRTLALLLAESGFNIALVAPEAEPAAVLTDIRAFALNHTSKALLERVRAWPAEAHVTPVLSMAVFGDAGGYTEFEPLDLHENLPSALNWIVDVPALNAALKQQVACKPQITCLASDAALKAKLYVVCEGKHSAMLRQLGIVGKTIRYPQHAIAARLRCEHPHQHAAKQWFNESGDVLALLPLGGAAADACEVALVWSLTSGYAKAMQRASPAEFIAALTRAAGHGAGELTLCSERVLWPLQRTRIEQWVGEQKYTEGLSKSKIWVLAGDAAHTMHPLAGQGLNVGLGDAALLFETLQSFLQKSPLFNPSPAALTRALEHYARARQAAAAEMTGVTDGLHLLFAHKHPLVQQARNWGMKLFNRVDSFKRHMIQKAQ
jgi:2-polyprenyl-6-methoxyphenol hydroxylase-like FAD-dependent oxidoreductase